MSQEQQTHNVVVVSSRRATSSMEAASITVRKKTRRRTTSTEGSQRQPQRLLCQIAEIEALYDEEKDSHAAADAASNPPHRPHYSCITRTDWRSSTSASSASSSSNFIASYDVRVSDAFRSRYGPAIERGKAEFSVPVRYLDPVTGVITIPGDENQADEDWDEVSPSSSASSSPPTVQLIRSLQQQDETQQAQEVSESLSGTKTVLAIRIKAPDGDAPETMDEIAAAIFGTSVDPNLVPIASVIAQYAAVSHNQLHLVPATGPGIYNGVTEITLNHTVKGARIQAELSSHILAVTAATLGRPLDAIADRIVYCVPSGSLLQGRDSWTAYTYLFQHYSFFQQSRCTKLSVVMHELGHSFGFRHSGANLDDYGDETDYMGYAVNQYGMPRKAFNAHKHWLSGWFTDRSVRVYPEMTGPVGAYLASFVDYSHPSLDANAVVLIRVGDLFLQYSEGKGYNVDTPTVARDRVLIAQADGPSEVSQLIGGVAVGEYYSYVGYTAEYDLVIEFCDQVVAPYGYAAISIHVADGNQTSVCNDPTAFGAGGLFSESSDHNTPKVGAGSLVFEDQGSETNPQREKTIIGVVWGFVSLLVLLSIYLVYRLRKERKKKRRVHKTAPSIPSEIVRHCSTDDSIASEDRVIAGSC